MFRRHRIIIGSTMRQPLAPQALTLAALLVLPAGAPSAGSAANSAWPSCDECEAVAHQIALVLDRQRKPQRKGGGLRDLTPSVFFSFFP